jgi:hypothetical protein
MLARKDMGAVIVVGRIASATGGRLTPSVRGA